MSKWKLVGRTPRPTAANQNTPESMVMVDGVDLAHLESEEMADEHPIVLWDATSATWRHVHIWEGTVGRRVIRFACDEREDLSSTYYVPAKRSEAGAFDVRSPRYEGHWRQDKKRTFFGLPWPKPAPGWPTRADFLAALARVEAQAEAVRYRGRSPCRLCGIDNGSIGYRLVEWEWPEGYRHYLADHDVRPTPDFESFVLTKAHPSARP